MAVAVVAIFALQDSVLVSLRLAPWVNLENVSFASGKIVVLPLLGLLPAGGGIAVSWVRPAGVVVVHIGPAARVFSAHLVPTLGSGHAIRDLRRRGGVSTSGGQMDGAAAEIAARAPGELDRLVGISSPSGDVAGAEQALALCVTLLPEAARIERPPCSTAGSAPDLIATVSGGGERRLMLLGHVDTVIGHEAHQPLRVDGDRLYGTGTADMKGGVVLSLGVARALARSPKRFAELAVLLVTDEEWRMAPFVHTARFAGYDACLCFEAGERTASGEEGVVVRRKAAGTLRVTAVGRAAHSGSAPDRGRNALLALAQTAQAVAALHDPNGPEQLSAVPTVIRSGAAFNVVPAGGELIFDLRARRLQAFEAVLGAIAPELDGVALQPRMERRWPGMDAAGATAGLIADASARLGRRIVGVPRGGASDASHFADSIALTIDGLGPRGGGAHTPEEFVLRAALAERTEVALALALAALS